MNYPAVILHKGKEHSFLRKHPWLFSGAIAKKDPSIKEGDLVQILSAKNEFLGTGFYASGSIAVRIITFKQEEINAEFWMHKIAHAVNYRKHLNLINDHTNVCRLFFGEGDGVPGLILDYYDGHVVLQAHSGGVYGYKQQIAEALHTVLGKELKSIYDKSAESLSKHHTQGVQNGFLFGKEEDIVVVENGHRFKVDFIKGQKTGFFIDQRDNRQLLAHYSKNKYVLNTFCYTGGFSV